MNGASERLRGGDLGEGPALNDPRGELWKPEFGECIIENCPTYLVQMYNDSK